MTFLQPNKNSNTTSRILALLAVALVVETFGMVALYNATVNANHNIAAAKAELDRIGAQTTDMNNRIVATLSSDALAKVAAADGLVTEAKPQYFTMGQTPLGQRTTSEHDLSLHALNR